MVGGFPLKSLRSRSDSPLHRVEQLDAQMCFLVLRLPVMGSPLLSPAGAKQNLLGFGSLLAAKPAPGLQHTQTAEPAEGMV